MNREERNKQLEAEQIQFMLECGGTLEGYIKRYGDPGALPVEGAAMYGEGGTKIFNADLKALQRCIDDVDGSTLNGRKANEVLSKAIGRNVGLPPLRPVDVLAAILLACLHETSRYGLNTVIKSCSYPLADHHSLRINTFYGEHWQVWSLKSVSLEEVDPA